MIDRRNAFKAALFAGLGAAQLTTVPTVAASQTKSTAPGRSLANMDMVHANPGQADPQTHYLDPAFLRARDYRAVVIEHAIEGVACFRAYDPDLIPDDSEEGQFAEKLRHEIKDRISAAKREGLAVYAWVQYVVLPKRVLEKYGSRLIDTAGRIDVQLADTQAIIKALTEEILKTFPGLDGLIVRTGEIYLHDLPYHDSRVSSAAGNSEGPIQAGTAIIHGQKSHLALLNLLRETVCVKANRKLFYRTWDFGNNFHNNSRYYLDVTDRVPTHKNLSFSIKHQCGDFHRLTPFNPTIGIGRHHQTIEIQCQMEAYGKGAYPYYVANGVINGWEEYDWLMPKGAMTSVRQAVSNPLISNLWTWSRGGGWDGPYIADELWCDLNAYVLSHFALDTSRTEISLFEQYCKDVLKLTSVDTEKFRYVCMASSAAVLRGQLTNLGVDIDVWWARDDTLSEPQLGDFIGKGLVEEAISEKQQAVTIWQQIAETMPHIRFADSNRQAFAEVSATYGLYKHSVIASGWTACLLAADSLKNGTSHKDRIRAAIASYDSSWLSWMRLRADSPLCPSLPKTLARGDKPGLGAAIDKLRALS